MHAIQSSRGRGGQATWPGPVAPPSLTHSTRPRLQAPLPRVKVEPPPPCSTAVAETSSPSRLPAPRRDCLPAHCPGLALINPGEWEQGLHRCHRPAAPCPPALVDAPAARPGPSDACSGRCVLPVLVRLRQGGHQVPPPQGGRTCPRAWQAQAQRRPQTQPLSRRAGCHLSSSDRALSPRFPLCRRRHVWASGWQDAGPVTPWSARPCVAAVVGPGGQLCHQATLTKGGFSSSPERLHPTPWSAAPTGALGERRPQAPTSRSPTCLLPEAPGFHQGCSQWVPCGSSGGAGPQDGWETGELPTREHMTLAGWMVPPWRHQREELPLLIMTSPASVVSGGAGRADLGSVPSPTTSAAARRPQRPSDRPPAPACTRERTLSPESHTHVPTSCTWMWMYAQHLTRWEGAMRVSHLRDSAGMDVPRAGGRMASVPRPSLTRQEERVQDSGGLGGAWWRVCGTRSTGRDPRQHAGRGRPPGLLPGHELSEMKPSSSVGSAVRGGAHSSQAADPVTSPRAAGSCRHVSGAASGRGLSSGRRITWRCWAHASP